MSAVTKTIHVILWAVSGVIVLPCVFVASAIYPKWIEWGEDF